MRRPLSWLTFLVLASAGCSADVPLNPRFPLTVDQANEVLNEMRAHPAPIERPVIVLAGIFDLGRNAIYVGRTLAEVTSGRESVAVIVFPGTENFDACCRRVVDAVTELWPNVDPDATTEVDVVGISMGGLVARAAARPRTDGRRRLAIHRLFTITTPHRGALLADWPTRDRRVRDMRAGSAFLYLLNHLTPEQDPEIIPYARLDDRIVGEDNTAPPGQEALWVANIPFTSAHVAANRDPRILADIARHLRGEPPFSIPGEGIEGTGDEP